MAVPYQFANTPNGSTIPLAKLDQNFDYVENQINSLSVVTSFSGGSTGLLPATATTGVITLTGRLNVANGGTGATTASGAMTNLLPAQTGQGGKFLTTDGSGNLSWAASGAGGVIGIANGGTGLTAAPTAGQLLIGNGTGYTLSTLTAGTGITISNTAGGITINSTGGTIPLGSVTPAMLSTGGPSWNTAGLLTSSGGISVTGGVSATQGFVASNGYFVGIPSGSNASNLALLGTSAAINLGGATVLQIGTGGNGSVLGTWGCNTNLTIASSSGGILTLRAPSTATNTTFNFPSTLGTNGFVLSTDGAGNTSWVAQSGGGSIPPGTVTPAMLSTGGPSWDVSGDLTVADGITAVGQIKTAAGIWAQNGYVAGQGTVGSATNIALLSGGIAFNFPGATVLSIGPTGNGSVSGTWGCVTQSTIYSTTGGLLTLKAPATPTNTTFTFPLTAGTSGYVLSTDGAGNTSWVAQSGGGSIPPGTVTPAMLSTGGPSWDAAGELTVASGITATTQIKTNAGFLGASGYFTGQGTPGNYTGLAMLTTSVAFNFGTNTVFSLDPAGDLSVTGTVQCTDVVINPVAGISNITFNPDCGIYSTSAGSGFLSGATVSGNVWILPNTVAAGLQATGPYTNTSDASLKKNVSPISNALDKVKQLEGVNFSWIADESNANQIGLIAQDVQKVLPEVVQQVLVGNTLGVSYGSIVAVLINAIKELEARVAELEAK